MTALPPQTIYTLLTNAGASTTQAIGIMANMWNESGFDPEEIQQGVSDPGYGLVQWEQSSYPGVAGLVTGNSQADAQSQIAYLAQTGGFQAATGPTPAAAAGNFAANYEECASCNPGGAQYQARVSNAATIMGWVTSGNWPQLAGNAATDTSAQATASTQTCLINYSGFFGLANFCALSKSEARAVMGALILTGGAVLGVLGVIILAVYGFEKTPAGRAASQALDATGLGMVMSRAFLSPQERTQLVQGPGRVIRAGTPRSSRSNRKGP
jgi:hypothetical protein